VAVLRKVRFGIAALACAAIWALGVWRFVAGETLLGSVLILLGGVTGAGLFGLYRRDTETASEGIIEAVLQFIHWGG
jgi:hypothetical protein